MPPYRPRTSDSPTSSSWLKKSSEAVEYVGFGIRKVIPKNFAEWFRSIRGEFADLWPIFVAIGVLFLIVVAVRAEIELQRYLKDHHCVVTYQAPGHYSYTTRFHKVGDISVPYQETTWHEGPKTYRCDGGETFTR